MDKQIISKKRAVIISLAIILTGAVLLVIYLAKMNDAIEGMTISNIRQLAEHDLNSIELETENSWVNLSGIYKRVKANDPETIQELCSRLNTEMASSSFEEVYLVDEKGNTYSGNNMIINRSDKELIKLILEGHERVAENEITGDRIEAEKETIAYGTRESAYTVEGVDIIGIFGFASVKHMEDRMNIRSYDGEGLSSVFDSEGYFIITPVRSAGMKSHDNYFDKLQKNYGLDGEAMSALKKRIVDEGEFYEIYSSGDAPEQIVYYNRMASTGWVFCTSIPSSVITHEAQPFMRMTVVSVIFLIFIIAGFAFVFVRFTISVINANARAQAHGSFLSNMSHELRTPLNAIIGFNALMQKHFSNREKMDDYLKKSEATAKYMLALINDILDMSKIQAGKVDIIREPFSLGSMLSTLESIIRGRMDDKEISFVIVADINSDLIIGDEIHVEQILINILSNASKFTDNGGRVTLNVSQQRSPEDENTVTTVFVIEDNGIGMSREFQKKIFDSFTQERNAIRNSIKGTGLGMSLSYMFARAMGGDLTVESELGEGSTFTLTLPAEISRDTVIAEAVEESADDSGTCRQMHILVAEDNELNAEILLDILEMCGMTAVRAVDGQDTLTKFEVSEHFEYDLILMDIQMPVYNGYETTKLIRALDRPDAAGIPIYACSANTFKDDMDKAYESGMNDFVTKPIDVGKLMEKLIIASKGYVNHENQ